MLLSIIIPVYNAEKFLVKCLDSVKNQTYQELEIILVNDGSTDNSGLICEEYAQKDHRFIVLHKENGGVSSARNMGLKVAKGEYIGFVDPDDWIDPEMFENLYQLMTEYQADVSMCGYFMENVSGKTLNQTIQPYILTFNRKDALNTIQNINGFQGFVCNKLFSANLIRQNPVILFDPDIAYGEDMLFCCQYFLKCKNIVYDSTPYYHYVLHAANATKPNYSLNKLTYLNALEQMIDLLSYVEGSEINKFKSLYMHTNISLLMYGIHEGKCKGTIRKHLKKNLNRYKLSDFIRSSIKISCAMARINIHLCYFFWIFHHTFSFIKDYIKSSYAKVFKSKTNPEV